MTILICSNAAGNPPPSVVVFITEVVSNYVSKTYNVGKLGNVWMCGSIFSKYLEKVFIPWLNEQNIPK